MTASLVYVVNSNIINLFDENKWKERIRDVDSSLFYSPHFKNGIYFNPWMKMDKKSFFTVLKWRFFTDKPVYRDEEEQFLPEVKPLTAEYLNLNDNFFSWIGHASVLIKTADNTLIFDPVLGEIPFVKKRRTQSALTYNEAGKINGRITILITHNHYDHLDEKSIQSFPNNTQFIVPAGLKDEITKMIGKIANVREIDWWSDIYIDGIKITFLPSQHWSRRLFREVNSSLWGSFLIDTGRKKLFICGDTGYSGLFREFAKKFKRIDYAFISAGAFHLRWFMYYAHQDDSEAIQAFYDLEAKKMIPVHWGSFRLGDEPEGYPAIHICKKLPEAIIMRHGDVIFMEK